MDNWKKHHRQYGGHSKPADQVKSTSPAPSTNLGRRRDGGPILAELGRDTAARAELLAIRARLKQ